MTTRDIGFLKWKDPSAWMETMRGPRWKARCAAENRRFSKAVEDAGGADAAPFKAADAEIIWDLGDVKVYQRRGIEWAWKGSSKKVRAGDLDLVAGCLVYSEEVGGGAERYAIRAVTPEGELWSKEGEHGFGPYVAIMERVYVLEATGPLQYSRLVSFNLEGKDKRVHYEEQDPSNALRLVRGENACLFLISENAGRQTLYHVGKSFKCLGEGVFHPVGFAPNSDEPCYFYREKKGWKARGAALESFPPFGACGIDLVLLNGLRAYRIHGKRHLYFKNRLVKTFFGEIDANPWAIWRGRAVDIVCGVERRKGIIDSKGCRIGPPTIHYSYKDGMAKSKDGSGVRWIVAHKGAPKGVIICGYGAYGTPTHIDLMRWKPFLDNGVAIGFALVRGGGDHTEEWAEAGRVQGKLRGVEDFEACIRAIQDVMNLGARRTCAFGRSAGGYLVGAAVVRNPDGGLFGSAYTEVPYVDVLRTASNPRLPLTKYEYLEFGDPAHNIADFETMLRLSPVDGLGRDGAPGVFVLCRTGINDRQVYAYESVKWMDALGGGEDKILAINGGQGHFTVGDSLYRERADDYAILMKRILG